MPKKILLIEDNLLTAKGLQYSLEREKYVVALATTKAAAVRALQETEFALCLIDINLPDGDGFQIATYVRDHHLASRMIFLTARDDEVDRLRGLELGATDYITKPFRIKELLLKVRNLLNLGQAVSTMISLGALKIQPDHHQVTFAGQEINLTALEYRLLLCLGESLNQVITRERLADEIWQASGKVVNDNTVSVYIKRLRQKLPQPELIITIKQLGYKLQIPLSSDETSHAPEN